LDTNAHWTFSALQPASNATNNATGANRRVVMTESYAPERRFGDSSAGSSW
jgi:hypothetical protein